MKIIITLCVLICWSNSFSLTNKNVMIFTAADNNLESYAISDLQEIQQKKYPQLTIKIQAHLNKISYRMIKDNDSLSQKKFNQINHPQSQLQDFLNWAYDKEKENYLILWGHGQGQKIETH